MTLAARTGDDKLAASGGRKSSWHVDVTLPDPRAAHLASGGSRHRRASLPGVEPAGRVAVEKGATREEEETEEEETGMGRGGGWRGLLNEIWV